MNGFWIMFGRAVGFFVLGVTLASLFVWCLVQGVLAHIAGNPNTALIYYFVAWLSGVSGMTLYWQAKNLLHYAKISQE
ncbi:MAG: hypothetical protein J4203_02410 [Candidatus Diapherotrites archaeon]|uniref:Uncharacterized protein n=2 Tax=Candidatus Iainarchaeum sp. TaxID=3101447 RepID=A0A8T4L5X5_9ARCH|nr:hypothetical protein [Candidatus Diapherotrites archaeon]